MDDPQRQAPADDAEIVRLQHEGLACIRGCVSDIQARLNQVFPATARLLNDLQ